MEKLNRILYGVCVVSLVVLGILFLIAIWWEVENEYLWKTIGSVIVIMLSSGFVFAFNYQILKIGVEAKNKKQSLTEQGRSG